MTHFAELAGRTSCLWNRLSLTRYGLRWTMDFDWALSNLLGTIVPELYLSHLHVWTWNPTWTDDIIIEMVSSSHSVTTGISHSVINRTLHAISITNFGFWVCQLDVEVLAKTPHAYAIAERACACTYQQKEIFQFGVIMRLSACQIQFVLSPSARLPVCSIDCSRLSPYIT